MTTISIPVECAAPCVAIVTDVATPADWQAVEAWSKRVGEAYVCEVLAHMKGGPCSPQLAVKQWAKYLNGTWRNQASRSA